MKQNTLLMPVLAILLISLTVEKVYSTIWTVNVQNFSFNPDNIPNVLLGDTVRWVWVSGSHTTTSTNIPVGAATWDAMINVEFPSFEYIPALSGVYNYVCTPHAGMGMDGSFTVLEPEGIADAGQVNDWVIAPNPFRDDLTVKQLPGVGATINTIDVIDYSGRVVYHDESLFSEPATSICLPLEGLTDGAYILVITDRKNNIYRNKILKE
jgi:plastocyanin